MIGMLLGAEGARDTGYRHPRGATSARREPGTDVSSLPTVTVEIDAIYCSARRAASPKRFGRPPFASKPIVEAELVEYDADTLTR